MLKVSIEKHKANVEVLLEKTAGILQNILIHLETIEKELAIIAEYDDELEMLNKYFKKKGLSNNNEIYTFENTKTGKVYDDMMSIAEKEDFLKKNKHIKQSSLTINISSGVRGMGGMKNDGGWKDNLSRIADGHQIDVAQQHKKRSIKEVKTQQVVEKHRRRQRGKK